MAAQSGQHLRRVHRGFGLSAALERRSDALGATRCVAVEQGADGATQQPASHRGKGWEAVTECAIRALAARAAPLVAILWGRDASTLKPMLAAGNCVAIESPHPSPLSASRGFFGSRPFSRANELLVGMGAEPIDWRLP